MRPIRQTHQYDIGTYPRENTARARTRIYTTYYYTPTLRPASPCNQYMRILSIHTRTLKTLPPSPGDCSNEKPFCRRTQPDR